MSTGGSWRFLNVTFRVDSPEQAAQALEAARSVDGRLRATLDSVDVLYADMFADVLLATRLTSAFAFLALLVGTIGVYGVATYVVASRRRELGIRLALGATPGKIVRFVLGGSGQLIALGIGLGIVGASIAMRWISTQFFGVSVASPGTYAAVGLAVATVALSATWLPAHRAGQVDPGITLKSE